MNIFSFVLRPGFARSRFFTVFLDGLLQNRPGFIDSKYPAGHFGPTGYLS